MLHENPMTGMDELICRSIEGRAAKAELRRLDAWRRASPTHEARFQETRRLLQVIEGEVRAEPIPPPPTVDHVVARGELRESSRLGRQASRRRWSWRIVPTVAVAAVALLLLLRPAEPEFSFGKGEFVTGAGETATMVLADGSVVRLAPLSTLRITGVAGSREVFLDGQAFFAVARMPEHPFRVRTRAGDARALGTQFEVVANDEDLRLVVLEGRVALESSGGEVEVKAGELSFVSHGMTSAPVKVEDVKPLVPWLERFLVFQSTPLREVAVQLEREYGVRVEIADSTLAELMVTGWYADKTFEEVIAVVCGVVNAKCLVEDGVARIGPRRGGAKVPPDLFRNELNLPIAEEQ